MGESTHAGTPPMRATARQAGTMDAEYYRFLIHPARFSHHVRQPHSVWIGAPRARPRHRLRCLCGAATHLQYRRDQGVHARHVHALSHLRRRRDPLPADVHHRRCALRSVRIRTRAARHHHGFCCFASGVPDVLYRSVPASRPRLRESGCLRGCSGRRVARGSGIARWLPGWSAPQLLRARVDSPPLGCEAPVGSTHRLDNRRRSCRHDPVLHDSVLRRNDAG